MLRYTTDRARPGLVTLYDIRPGNGAGQFLQPWSPHGATQVKQAKQRCLKFYHFVSVSNATDPQNFIQICSKLFELC